MLNFRFLFLSFILVLSSSCFRDAEKQSGKKALSYGSADFIVKSVNGLSKDISTSDSWSMPDKKQYDFRACLITKNTSSKLSIGQVFHVVHPDKTYTATQTDKHGCLNWQESIDFNMAVDSKYVEVKRTLQGKGIYDGDATVRVGVNPWAQYRSESHQEVVNLDEVILSGNHLVRGEASKLAFMGRFEKSFGEDLILDENISVNFTVVGDEKNGKRVRITLKAKPYIEPLNMAGEPVPYYFKKAKFRVYPQVIANNVGNKAANKMLLMPLLPKTVDLNRKGMLVYQEEVVLSKEVTTGQLELALKLEPVSAPVELNQFEALYELASFEGLVGGHSGLTEIRGLDSKEGFDYARYISQAKNFEDLKKMGLAFDLKPVRFKELDIRFVRVAPGETATRRTIIFRVQTQVVDTLTGAPLRKQRFKIKKDLTGTTQKRTDMSGNETDIISTTDDGILKWTDEISHFFYVAEQFYYPEVELTQVDSGYQEKIKMALNPWNSGWTFGTDYRGRKDFYDRMNKTEKRDSTFMIDAFRYQTIRFRYEIDEFMTLNVKKAVVMAMDPLTQRYTIEEGRKGGEPLRDGIYLVKLALVKYYIDPFKNGTKLFHDKDTGKHRVVKVSDDAEYKEGKYYTIVKKLLRVQGGRITTPIEFSMRDLRMMSIRSNILVQIETVDEQRLLRDNIVDRKLRELVDAWKIENSKTLSEAEKEKFFDKTDLIFEQERAKLVDSMSTELRDLQEQRLQLADSEAQRYQELYDLEERIKDEDTLADRKRRRKEILSMKEKDFMNYISEIRSDLDSMERKFQATWQQWNRDMGLPSNEIQDWTEYDRELGKKPYAVRAFYENQDKERVKRGENKSVYDYLASMQLFMDKHDLPNDITNTDLRTMRLNNYTANPAAPFIDLNLYRLNAGLKRRTFIGPCTLVANDNLSEMRPTDTIDEKYCKRIDCSDNLIKFGYEVDNKKFEDSAYHGAIKPFAMMHVDNVIDLYKESEQEYIHNMRALSQVGRFLEKYNMDYVSLTDDKSSVTKFKKDCRASENKNTDPSELDVDKYSHCYESTHKNVVSIREFERRIKGSYSSILLKQYFKYNFYETHKEDEATINQVPTLVEGVTEKLPEMVFDGDAQEELFGESLGDMIRDIFTDHRNQDRYIEEFEDGKLKKFDRTALKQLLNPEEYNRSRELSLLEGVKLCGILTQGVVNQLYARDHFEKYTTGGRVKRLSTKYVDTKKLLLKKCLKQIEFNPDTGKIKAPHLSFDRRYRVLETGTYEHIEGKNMNLNIGYGFSLSDDKSNTTSAALTLGAEVGGAVSVGKVLSLSAGVAAEGGLSVSESNTVSLAKGSSVDTATFLVVQQATMDIQFKKYEKCFTAHLMPSLYYDLTAEELFLKKGTKLTDESVKSTLSRGIMVCEGKIRTKPINKKENYYYLTQHFTAGDLLDEGNLLNHIWLLALRGSTDFNKFMNLVNAKPTGSEGELINEADRTTYPNVHLRKSYNQIVPSFPGMYTEQFK